ncbi:MAG: 3,4-dioxygenase subunit beta, partial [Thermocrispum sp.]
MTDHTEEHDLGLSHDLPRIIERRRALRLFGGAGVVAAAGGVLTACGQASPPAGGQPDVEVPEGEIPEETAGPFPGDGSNGVNVLSESGVVRRDITGSFGGAAGVAEGVPVTLKLK